MLDIMDDYLFELRLKLLDIYPGASITRLDLITIHTSGINITLQFKWFEGSCRLLGFPNKKRVLNISFYESDTGTIEAYIINPKNVKKGVKSLHSIISRILDKSIPKPQPLQKLNLCSVGRGIGSASITNFQKERLLLINNDRFVICTEFLELYTTYHSIPRLSVCLAETIEGGVSKFKYVINCNYEEYVVASDADPNRILENIPSLLVNIPVHYPKFQELCLYLLDYWNF